MMYDLTIHSAAGVPGEALPVLLALLPTLDLGTVFLLLLSLCAIVTVWGVIQLAGVLRGDDDARLERRLGLREVNAAIAPDSALLRMPEHPGWLEQSDRFDKFALRLGLVYPGQTLSRFFLTSAIAGVVVGGLTALLLGPFPFGFAAGVIAGLIPYLRYRMVYGKRRKLLADQLVEALDFLSRVLRAGHSLPSGLQMVGDELPDPIATEFRRCYEQQNLGLSLEQALEEAAGRVDLEDFAFFVTSVNIQRQTGGDLAEILDNINTMIRGRIRLAQHVQALTAEGRFSGYILTAMPVVVFGLMLMMNPTYATELLTRSLGRIALFGALGLQVVGLLLIRRIVNVRV